MWSNKISKDYSDRKKRFENMFPEAYEFLTKLEQLKHLDFHLGTSKNLHLYHKKNFLVYIKIEPPLKFFMSREYNERLKKDAPISNPELFFTPFLAEVRSASLHLEYDDDLIRIRANDKASRIFECCYKALSNIANVDLETIIERGNRCHV